MIQIGTGLINTSGKGNFNSGKGVSSKECTLTYALDLLPPELRRAILCTY